MAEEFVAYVGDPDLHDGEIVAVHCEGSTALVQVRGESGDLFELAFAGAEFVAQHRAVGMKVYAVSEMRSPTSLRRFVFSNWDETDDAALEIQATDFDCGRLSA